MSKPSSLRLGYPGVFECDVPLEEVNGWLVDPGADLVDVNSAIDNAASWAGDTGVAYVVIKVHR